MGRWPLTLVLGAIGGAAAALAPDLRTPPSAGPSPVRVAVDPDPRPVDLTVVVDASGSMAVEGRLDVARRVVNDLARSLHPADTLEIVSFADDATVLVPRGPVDDPQRFDRLLDELLPGGNSNLYAGVAVGAARLPRDAGRRQRLVVLSDGMPNAGIVDPARLADYAAQLERAGIEVSRMSLDGEADGGVAR